MNDPAFATRARRFLFGLLAPALLGAAACAAPGPWREGRPAVELESEHFRLETDAGTLRARQVLERAEVIRAEVAALFHAPAGWRRVRLVLFTDHDDYLRYVGPWAGPALTRGGYRPPPPGGRSEILLPPVAHPESLLRHELAHHYLHQMLPDPPPWLDEGIAEFVTGLAHPELVEDSLRVVREAREDGTGLTDEALRALDRATFYARGVGAYAAAHLLVRGLVAEQGCRLDDPAAFLRVD